MSLSNDFVGGCAMISANHLPRDLLACDDKMILSSLSVRRDCLSGLSDVVQHKGSLVWVCAVSNAISILITLDCIRWFHQLTESHIKSRFASFFGMISCHFCRLDGHQQFIQMCWLSPAITITHIIESFE
jgi:hypothetical protein